MSSGFRLPSLGASLIWKAATGLAVAAVVALSIMLVIAQRESADLLVQRNELQKQINDPQVGLVARLQQSQQNVATLRTSFERQIVVMRERAEADRVALENTRRQVVAANARAAAAERAAQRFAARPIRGNTLEERVRDVDARIMEELNRAQQ